MQAIRGHSNGPSAPSYVPIHVWSYMTCIHMYMCIVCIQHTYTYVYVLMANHCHLSKTMWRNPSEAEGAIQDILITQNPHTAGCFPLMSIPNGIIVLRRMCIISTTQYCQVLSLWEKRPGALVPRGEW